MSRARVEPSAWTRPQQLVAAGYGLWAAVCTVVLGAVVDTPARLAATMRDQGYDAAFVHAHASHTAYVGAVEGDAVVAVLYLVIGLCAYRRHGWAFWAAVTWFGITGLGALWVPLRPRAHAGEEGLALVLHAFVNDLPGLLVAAWLLVGLGRYGRSWARRRPPSRQLASLGDPAVPK